MVERPINTTAQDPIEVLRRGSLEAWRLLGVVLGEGTSEHVQSPCRKVSGRMAPGWTSIGRTLTCRRRESSWIGELRAKAVVDRPSNATDQDPIEDSGWATRRHDDCQA